MEEVKNFCRSFQSYREGNRTQARRRNGASACLEERVMIGKVMEGFMGPAPSRSSGAAFADIQGHRSRLQPATLAPRKHEMALRYAPPWWPAAPCFSAARRIFLPPSRRRPMTISVPFSKRYKRRCRESAESQSERYRRQWPSSCFGAELTAILFQQ